MSMDVEDAVAVEPRKRGRPSYVSQALAEEIALRTYIASFEPPLSYAKAMAQSPKDIAKLRRDASGYVVWIRKFTQVCVEMDILPATIFHDYEGAKSSDATTNA